MAYAFEEYARLEKERRNQGWRRGTSDRPGILAEMRALLQHYRAELLAESGRLLQEGATREHISPVRHQSTSPKRSRTPAYTPAPTPAPERAPTKVPEKVPEK